MIQIMTKLNVADNSGAKVCQCIGIHGAGNKRYATIGDIITVSVKKALPNSDIKKGSLSPGVIVRTKKEFRRKDGTYIRFDDNAVVLLTNEGEPMGTRVFGPVARELREQSHTRIISLAPEVI